VAGSEHAHLNTVFSLESGWYLADLAESLINSEVASNSKHGGVSLFSANPFAPRLRRFSASAAFLLSAIALCVIVLPLNAQSQTSQSDEENAILAHLNAVINWYKQLTTQIPPAQEPSDTIYATNAQNMAAQVARLAFQSARAQVALSTQASGSNSGQNTQNNQKGSSSTDKYVQLEAQVSQRVAQDQANIEQLKAKPARGSQAAAKTQQLQSLEGKLALDQATLAAVQQMENFVEQSNAGGTGVERNINELARSVPEVFNSNSQASAKPAAPAAAKPQENPSSGLFGQLITLYKEMLSIRSIEQRMDENDNIQKIANGLRAPLHQKMSDTFQQGQKLSAENNAPKEQYDAVTQQFKQLSAALLPLSEEVLVLDQSRSNLLDWRREHTSESRSLLLSILLRVAVILIAIAIIFGVAEAWRRLTFRYIRDPRRRRQFLILRRFVMGFFICSVVVLGFVSEFSSLATFAGFVTAGIAVGLQTVLLSVAAYFFVIGRYGIRVGDRITIAGVTGDVIDLGLVRFYVAEYAASGADLFPTGRIVVFSNSVLFQPTTPLFKQLPGSHYTWHEAVLPLTSGADPESLGKLVSGAVDSVYQEYKRQPGWQNAFSYDMDISVKPPEPEHRLQFSDTGAELVVRYPVDLHRAPEIDEKIMRALMEKLGSNGKLSSGLAGTPKIRSVVKL
jgi:small-conductance mechanosensitive channel